MAFCGNLNKMKIPKIILNLLFAYGQKWFYTLKPNCYFVKVNGNWEMYKDYAEYGKRSFKKNEKIEAIWGRNFESKVYCQNEKCQSLVIYGSKGCRMEWGKNVVYCYVCSCCDKTQNFLLESRIENKKVVQIMTPCGQFGELLKVADDSFSGTIELSHSEGEKLIRQGMRQ